MKLLNVGCGPKSNKLPPGYESVKEVRMDIDRAVEPDFVSLIENLRFFTPEQYDIVYASHVLEHVPKQETIWALKGIHNILKTGGALHGRVPDISSLDGKRMDDICYSLNGVNYTKHDIMYGVDKPNMAHKCGFDQWSLQHHLVEAGFSNLHIVRLPEHYELHFLAWKGAPNPQVRALYEA